MDPSTTTSPATALLDAAARRTREIRLAEAARFELAARWAEAHPAPVTDRVVDDEGTLQMYGDQPVTLAGEGAPGMSEFAIAEFAAAIGISTYSGRALIGSALECKHRLPDIWARAMAGQVPVWKVRKVTERTHRLPQPEARAVDRTLAPVLDTCSFAQIERAVATVEAQVDAERVEEEHLDRWQQQHVDLDLSHASVTGNLGLVPINGLLAYPDAVALEQALQATAHDLLDEHPGLDLDIRRAMALGQLASAAASGSRELVIYTHHDPTESHGIVEVEGTGHTTIDQLLGWCTSAGAKVSLRPVLDLDAELRVDRYEPTPTQREQAVLTTPTCVFPHCGWSARRCDLDHVVPYAAGGPTTSWNLAPLCRLHHRMKTHGHWSYRRLTRTCFEWTSPTGHHHTVDHTLARRHIR